METKVISKKYIDVSVIIPVYNSADTIERAVKSVVRQEMLPKEIIIVDDFSADIEVKHVLLEIKDRYADAIDIKIIFLEKNVGAGSARNAGWNNTSCKYVAFLDSDDVWHPQKLKIQYEIMESSENIFLSFHKLAVVKFNEKNLFYEKIYSDNLILCSMNPIRKLFKHYPSTSTSAVMLRNKSKFRFKDGKRYAEDYLLWLEMLFNFKGVYINEELGAVFKELYGVSGLSSNMWEIEKGEIETFKVLKNKNYISYSLYILAVSFSFIKYIRRNIICTLRKCLKGYTG